MSVAIGRPINGISLNGLEYVLDDNGNEMLFCDRAAAEDFLHKHGYTDEDIEDSEIVFEDVNDE